MPPLLRWHRMRYLPKRPLCSGGADAIRLLLLPRGAARPVSLAVSFPETPSDPRLRGPGGQSPLDHGAQPVTSTNVAHSKWRAQGGADSRKKKPPQQRGGTTCLIHYTCVGRKKTC